MPKTEKGPVFQKSEENKTGTRSKGRKCDVTLFLPMNKGPLGIHQVKLVVKPAQGPSFKVS